MSNVFTKDPDAILDYGWDWSAWLSGGDTISASSWTVPTGLTTPANSRTTTTTTVWLSGGTAGAQYEVINRITTTGGRTDDRTIVIQCEQR